MPHVKDESGMLRSDPTMVMKMDEKVRAEMVKERRREKEIEEVNRVRSTITYDVSSMVVSWTVIYIS